VDRHVFIIGFMGAGKSTVGRVVADTLGLGFVDLDERIVAAEGRDVVAIFEHGGEARFRAAETAALAALADEAPSVVACGGGIVLDDGNRALLKRLGTVVYLEVGAEEAMARIGDTSGRPLLAGGGLAMATSILRSRVALYEATADRVVATAGKTPAEVATAVVDALGGAA